MGRILVWCLVWATTVAGSIQAQAAEPEVEPIDAVAYLCSTPQPIFAEGHTLPKLTRYGWTLPIPLRIELAEKWGYALEFGGYAGQKAQDALNDPESAQARLAALARSDPERFALSVILPRTLPGTKGDVVVTAEPDRPAVEDKTGPGAATQPAENASATQPASRDPWTRTAAGELVVGKRIWSPEAPQAFIDAAARVRAEAVAAVREHAPIAIVLNGGEYALSVPGHHKKFWSQDPRIMAAKGDRSWFAYISQRKAEMELAIANAVRAEVPDRQLYIYYTTSGGTHRHRWPGWVNWSYGYEWMKRVSDLPSDEAYYRHYNHGWAGKRDILTLLLNAKGWEIKHDEPLGYNWLCAGWPRGKTDDGRVKGLGDLTRYTGFLKCLYVSGMLGGNAGYYAYPPGGFGAGFDVADPPHWLRQIEVLGRVHAMFSHLEPLVRNSDLLPGPDRHVYSKQHPAYELPTQDPDHDAKASRVVARKQRGEDVWLLAAWAASGEARDIGVTLPDVGELSLRARPAGSVYHVSRDDDGELNVRLLDEQAALPSQAMPTDF